MRTITTRGPTTTALYQLAYRPPVCTHYLPNLARAARLQRGRSQEGCACCPLLWGIRLLLLHLWQGHNPTLGRALGLLHKGGWQQTWSQVHGTRLGGAWKSGRRFLPVTGLLRKLQQDQAPAEDCWHPLVKTQGLCQVGSAQSLYLFAALLKPGRGMVGLCAQPKGPLKRSLDGAVEENQASFDKGDMEAVLLPPQTLTQYWAAVASVRTTLGAVVNLVPSDHTHPALLNVAANIPSEHTQNLLLPGAVITKPASQSPVCNGSTAELLTPAHCLLILNETHYTTHPSTRPAHHSQTRGWARPNLAHPPNPPCPTHHGKLQALAPTTLLALLVAAPEFGLVAAEVAVATVHPP